MNANHYQLYKSRKCRIGFSFIVLLNYFDENTGECLLTKTEERLYSFTCIKCNFQTCINFDIAFCKESILAVIQGTEKEQKTSLMLMMMTMMAMTMTMIFFGKYPLHQREKPKRFLKQKLDKKTKEKDKK